MNRRRGSTLIPIFTILINAAVLVFLLASSSAAFALPKRDPGGGCTPECGTRTCGSDGCGGSCGHCASGSVCNGHQCVCARQCSGKQCGPDGCGGTCGSCASGTVCSAGQCVCAPQCSGKQCGPDGCGGSCGTCGANETCSANQCVVDVPECVGFSSADSTRAAASGWIVPDTGCMPTGAQPLPPAPQPMVVTQQKLRMTGGGPFLSPSTSHPAGGDPVLGDGEFYEQRVDASLAGLGPHYEFKRTYRSRADFQGQLGPSWDHSYDKRIIGLYKLKPARIDPYCDTSIYYQDGALNLIRFTQVPGSSPPLYTAPGVALTIDRVTDASGTPHWRVHDAGGQTLYFDALGYLATITDAAGNQLTFTWETPPKSDPRPDDKVHGILRRLASVQDGARTVHYLYDDDGTLKCISLGLGCGDASSRSADVLAYFTYSKQGELEQVFHGTATTGERIVYRSATLPNASVAPYLPLDCMTNATLDAYCHRLCDYVDENNYYATCSNLDMNITVRTFCEYWSCQDTQQGLVCSQGPRQGEPDQLCMGQYNMSPDCLTGCASRYQCKNATSLQPFYAFGSMDDLRHNITDIYDEKGILVVHNEYGEDPGSIAFDRVVSQQLGPAGDEANTLTFDYHDLTLEENGSSVPQSPGSTPDWNDVVAASDYQEDNLCPVSGSCQPAPDGTCTIWTYGSPRADTGGILAPKAKNAVVVHDLRGVTRTQYFDSSWNLIRETNITAGETTDYNYDTRGFLRAIKAPSGVRSCFERDSYGHTLQATTLPAPGYLGPQTPMASAYRYDAANQLTDVWSDVFGALTRTHYERDGHERVAYIEQDVTAGQPPERTTLTYDEDPAPVGIRETPATVVLADGTVNTFRTIDPSLGGPTVITLDANGPDPEHRYVVYDNHGRVREAGEVDRFAVQYTYDDTNRLVSVGHRLDANSPWIATQIDSHEGNGQLAIDAITEPLRYTTFQYLGQYPNVVSYVAKHAQLGEETQVSCLHYGADGRMEGEILPQGNELQYGYDTAGRLTSITKGFPATTPAAAAWRSACSGRVAPPGDTGPVVLAASTYRNGGFLSSVQHGAVRRELTTDGFGRVIQSQAPASSSVKLAVRQTGYDARGQVIWQADFDPIALPAGQYQKPGPKTPGLLSLTEFEHDLVGRITLERDWVLETGAALTTTYTYDDAHDTITVDDRGATTVSKYDGRGRLTSRIFPDQSTLKVDHFLGYDVTTRQTNQPAPLIRRINYDTRGDITSIQDENDKVLYSAGYDDHQNQITEQQTGAGLVTRTFDVFDRLYREQRDLGGGTSEQHFGWDTNNRLRTYDGFTILRGGFDQPLKITDPLGRDETYSYVAGFAEPAGHVDATGRHVCLRYDDEMRLQYVYDTDCPAGTADVRGPIAPLADRRELGYTLQGQLASVLTRQDAAHAQDASVSYEYDSLGREILASVSGVTSYDVQHAYSDAGRTVTTTVSGKVPDSPLACGSGPTLCPATAPQLWYASFRHRHDQLDRLASVDLNDARLATWDYGVGAGGPLSLAYANGATTTFSYDPRLRQTRMDVRFQPAGATTPTTIASFAEAFGADGIPRLRQRTLGALTLTDAFQVDGDGRVSAEHPQMTDPVAWPSGEITNADTAPYMSSGARRTYQLDNNGNWLSAAESGNPAVVHHMDALGRLTGLGDVAVNIDTHDNLQGLAGDPVQLTFDSFSGRMLTGSNGDTTRRYDYDALDRRASESGPDGTTLFLWDGDQIVAHGQAGNLTVDVPGDDVDEHIASVTNNGTGSATFYHQGPDQSVFAISGTNGLVEGYSYTAFGETTVWGANGTKLNGSLVGNRFAFQGQLYDPLTGTYSMRAREYAPKWGRFVSPDPLSFAGGPSVYSFTGSRPLSARDPFGLSTKVTPPPPKQCGDGSTDCLSPTQNPGGADGTGQQPPSAGSGSGDGPGYTVVSPGPFGPPLRFPSPPSPHGTVTLGGVRLPGPSGAGGRGPGGRPPLGSGQSPINLPRPMPPLPANNLIASPAAGATLGGEVGAPFGPVAAVAGAILGAAGGGFLIHVGIEQVKKWLDHQSESTEESGPQGPPSGKPDATPDFSDGSRPPGPGWEWKGRDPPGGPRGNWHNPGTGESLHPDLDHPPPIGPHWDYDGPMGKFRWFPDGSLEPK